MRRCRGDVTLTTAPQAGTLAALAQDYAAHLSMRAYAVEVVTRTRRRLGVFTAWTAARGVMVPHELTRDHIHAFARWQETQRGSNGESPAARSLRGRLEALQGFGAWLERGGHITTDPRVVPLSPDACRWLSRYVNDIRPVLVRATGSGPESAARRQRAELPTADSALFLSRWDAGLWHGCIAWTLGPYLEMAGLTRSRGLTCLREAAAVQLLEAGCDLRYLAALFGFRSLASVQRYAAVSVQRFKRVHAQFHPAEQGDGNPASTAAESVQNPRTPGAS